MKTPEEILTEVSKTIAHMHKRPSMYIGSTSRPNAGEMFDSMNWLAHWFWATVQSREQDFREAVAAVRESHQCGCLGFADTYRRQHPNSDEESVFQHVRNCWAEISDRLGIDPSFQSGG